MRLSRVKVFSVLAGGVLLGGAAQAQAQTGAAAINNGDNAWMLLSAALVLMMSGPGLALFYGG